MPGVGAALGYFVHHGSRIPSVFRAEVIGGDLIFGDPIDILDEQRRAADRVVVVILPVHLLVVVLAAQAVDAESRTVVVGKSIEIASAVHTGQLQSEEIKALILTDS